MSFSITGVTRVGLKVTGLNEAIAALGAMQREAPRAKMDIHRKAITFFVLKAKERVHKISGDLGRSIEVESITPQMGVAHAAMPYARKEEERKGNRRTAPNTPHAYMKPAALDTALQMPTFTKQGFDALLSRHKTR